MYGTFPNFKTDLDNNFYKPNAILKKPLFIGNDVEMLLPKLYQYKKTSKITDILNSSYIITLIISNDLKKIFDNNIIYEMSYFRTSFTTLNNEKLDYYFVKPKFEALDCIDFHESEFYVWENIGPLNKSRKNPLKFKNKNELIEYEKKGGEPYEIIKLVINKDWNFDFFALKMVEDFALCFIISERLKTIIEESGMTGIGFMELNLQNNK